LWSNKRLQVIAAERVAFSLLWLGCKNNNKLLVSRIALERGNGVPAKTRSAADLILQMTHLSQTKSLRDKLLAELTICMYQLQ
jgi:hypothetical protein